MMRSTLLSYDRFNLPSPKPGHPRTLFAAAISRARNTLRFLCFVLGYLNRFALSRHTSAGHRCRLRHTFAEHRWRLRHASAGHRCRLRHTSAGHRWRTKHITQRHIGKQYISISATTRGTISNPPRLLRESYANPPRLLRERFLAATRTLSSFLSLTERLAPKLSL